MKNRKKFFVSVLVLASVVLAVVFFARKNKQRTVPVQTTQNQITNQQQDQQQNASKTLTQEQIDFIVKKVESLIKKSNGTASLEDMAEDLSKDGISEEDCAIAIPTKLHQLNNVADGKKTPWRGTFGYNEGNKFFNKPAPFSDIPEGAAFIKILYFYGDSVATFSDKIVELELTANSICVYEKTTGHPRIAFPCQDSGAKGNPIFWGDEVQLYGTIKDNVVIVSKMIDFSFQGENSSPWFQN